MEFNIVVLPMCIVLAIGIAAATICSGILVYVHEWGHKLAMRRESKKTPEFADELETQILLKAGIYSREGYTNSNYMKFLSENTAKYEKQIHNIARAGVCFSISVFGSGLIMCAAVVCLCSNIIGLTVATIMSALCLPYILMDPYCYLTGKNEQPDREISRHPQTYDYNIMPEWVKGRLDISHSVKY